MSERWSGTGVDQGTISIGVHFIEAGEEASASGPPTGWTVGGEGDNSRFDPAWAPTMTAPEPGAEPAM